jgi:YHS domain-containing protein
MGLLLWILRVLVILLILRYVVALIRGMGAAPARRAAPRRPIERTGGNLVRDPQCGTFVPEAGSLSIERAGSTWHFCSTTCRDTWMQAHR